MMDGEDDVLKFRILLQPLYGETMLLGASAVMWRLCMAELACVPSHSAILLLLDSPSAQVESILVFSHSATIFCDASTAFWQSPDMSADTFR